MRILRASIPADFLPTDGSGVDLLVTFYDNPNQADVAVRPLADEFTQRSLRWSPPVELVAEPMSPTKDGAA